MAEKEKKRDRVNEHKNREKIEESRESGHPVEYQKY